MTCFSSTRFFISSTFISNTRLKLAKMQAKTNQNPKTELLPFENHSISSSIEKLILYILKNVQKQACMF